MKNKTEIPFAILLVDDEEEILFSTGITLRSAGFSNVSTVNDSRKVMQFLNKQEVAVIVLDLNMPFISGYELLKEIAGSFPQIPVIVMTAANEIEMAVACMKAGAFDYYVKPVEKDRLVSSVRKAAEMHSLRSEVSSLKQHLLTDRLEHEDAFASIITRSNKMRGIFHYLEAVAGTGQPVLICGETGVGKELVARAVHELSDRKGAFIAVNVAGLDDLMFSDTLFGHKKGAYTGADQKRDGLLLQAGDGTLFLDEIGDINEASQIKLLRLLQEQEYYRLGSDLPMKSGARLVFATNCDLQQMITEHSFRKDLYYRLRAHQVQIPPLRERPEDIPLLLDHFLETAAIALNKKKPTPPPELAHYLAAYDFPGNIREFQSMVFDAVTRHQKGMLSMDCFMPMIAMKQSIGNKHPSSGAAVLSSPVDVFHVKQGNFPTLKDAEVFLIDQALQLANGNQGIAASYLGITRQALNKRLSRKCDDEQP